MNINQLLLFIFFINLVNIPAYSKPENISEANKLSSRKLKLDDFITTSSFKGSLFFTLGGISSSSSNESIQFSYENKIRLKTSFNGDDELLTIFESGNAFNSPLNLDLQSKKGDEINISNIFYKTRIGNEFEFFVGPKMFGYMGLAGKSSIYNERIAILDGSIFTTSAGNGPGIGITYNNKKGINSSLKMSSNDSSFQEKSKFYIYQIGLTKNNFGGTITSNHNTNFDAYGVALFYRPKNLPSISVSMEQKDTNNGTKTNNWIIGMQKKFDNKIYGFALGTHNSEENIAYEAWSKIQITDKIELIPIIFTRETNSENDFGVALNTRFRY